MEAILGPLLSFLLLYKYTALFFIAFISAFAVPVPASTMLAACGAFAYQGYMNLPLVILVALAGNVAGDAAGYVLARRYGDQILRSFGFRRMSRTSRFEKIRSSIHDFPHALIFFSRFLTEIGPAVNILAGISQVNVGTFFCLMFSGKHRMCCCMLCSGSRSVCNGKAASAF